VLGESKRVVTVLSAFFRRYIFYLIDCSLFILRRENRDFGHGDRLGKPLVLAPAMNTGMWQHPLTQCHLQTIKSFWNSSKGVNQIMIIEPKVESTLACGERGTGAMAEVHHIVEGVKKLLKEQ
jgi:hypothetical protein